MKRLLVFMLCCLMLAGSWHAAGAGYFYKDAAEILERRSSTKDMDDVIKQAYPQNKLLDVLAFDDEKDILLEWLNENYPVECCRTFEDGSLPYCIYKLQEGGYVLIYIRGRGTQKFVDTVLIAKAALTQSDFDEICPGKNLLDVESIDPGAELYNLLHWNRLGKQPSLQTFHLVKEGFITVSYRNQTGGNENIQRNDPADFIVESVTFTPNGDRLYEKNLYQRYAFLPQDYPSDMSKPFFGYITAYWWVLPAAMLLFAGIFTVCWVKFQRKSSISSDSQEGHIQGTGE